MATRFHGVTSLGLVLVAIVLAAVAAFLTSWVLGLAYLAVCAVAPAGILVAYCAKCPCQSHCGHLFPGKLAMRFLDRQPGPYTPAELGTVGLALLLLLGLPQVWLWRYPLLFAVYWVLNAVALIEIRAVVCRSCENVYCPARSRS